MHRVSQLRHSCLRANAASDCDDKTRFWNVKDGAEVKESFAGGNFKFSKDKKKHQVSKHVISTSEDLVLVQHAMKGAKGCTGTTGWKGYNAGGLLPRARGDQRSQLCRQRDCREVYKRGCTAPACSVSDARGGTGSDVRSAAKYIRGKFKLSGSSWNC